MRILTIGNFTTGWDGSICDEAHIADTLESLGHNVTRWQRGEEVPQMMIRPDFVLVAQWDGYDIGEIKKLGIPIVYWAFDYQADGQEWHEKLIASADLYLSKPFSDSKYPNWRWLSQDFAPSFLDQAPDIEKDIDVLFTGSWVPWESGKERVEYLKLIDRRFNLQINSFTPDQWKAEGFKNVQGPVMDDALPSLIARAKINFSMDHVIAPGYWLDRNAQIMCCGGFVLYKYVPFSEATFRDNIAYCHTVEDCLYQIGYYLENEWTARIKGHNGYRYAQYNLKVANRVIDLLTIVGSIL